MVSAAPVNLLTGTPELRPGVFFECVGVPGVIDQMLVGAARGCRFVIVGVCMEPDQIRPLLAITNEINMQFVLAYTVEEFARTLSLIAEGKLLANPLITGKVGVERRRRCVSRPRQSGSAREDHRGALAGLKSRD